MTKEWYVIHVRSGYETKVKQAIEEIFKQEKLTDALERILIPTENVIELKDGQTKNTERKFFPGYMLINLDLTEHSWLLIKNIANVIGFVGGNHNRPASVPHHEIEQILTRIQEGVDKPKPKVTYQVGQEVLITNGPFKEFTATVEEVEFEKNTLKVTVLIFGRSTPVDLDFNQVEKI